MTVSDKLFAGSIPETYDRYLVPLIFEACAADLAGRVAEAPAARVLETAAGTGVLTRALASRLPKETELVATDLNQPMIDYAKSRQPAGRGIEWRQADATALPFADKSFDAVVCQFGAMFFPDKVQGYKEARRVLKPGGRYIFNVWGRISDNEFADTVTQALAKLFPANPPRFLARTPHGYNDLQRIGEELTAAGFTKISSAAVDGISRAASPDEPAIAYCQGTPLRNEIEACRPGSLEEATKTAAAALAERFGKGAIEGRIRAYVISAT